MIVSSSGGPVEQIEAAADVLRVSTTTELLRRLKGEEFEFLEHAVLKLLLAMGYGGSTEEVVHSAGPVMAVSME
ncbi:MAG: hypothetical protein WCF24_04860 [Acidimicrobiales bacterium]